MDFRRRKLFSWSGADFGECVRSNAALRSVVTRRVRKQERRGIVAEIDREQDDADREADENLDRYMVAIVAVRGNAEDSR